MSRRKYPVPRPVPFYPYIGEAAYAALKEASEEIVRLRAQFFGLALIRDEVDRRIAATLGEWKEQREKQHDAVLWVAR